VELWQQSAARCYLVGVVGTYPVSGIEIRFTSDEVLPAVVLTRSHSHVQGGAEKLRGGRREQSVAWNR